jgi:succinate-semialdehyde dehydrogenase/glutarate-semialdehyde dehydrogenase
MTVQPLITALQDMAMDPIPCRAPATGAVFAHVPVDDAANVQAAVDRARAAQPAWAALSVRERARVLMRFRDLTRERGSALTELLSLECGKPVMEAYMAEVFTLLDLTTYFARRAHRILKPRGIRLHLMLHRRSFLHYTPRGVIGIISPWNFPLIIPGGDIVVALLAGNGVVLKPSETTPLIAMKLRELLVEAGVPADLFQLVNGYGETGAALIEAGVDKIVFTGSVATGRKVGEACARHLIPCALELGGKAPFVVLPGANLERAAQAMVWGAFVNSGQVCVSVERAYVHRSLYEPLVARVVELTQRLRQGNPAEEAVDVGAIIHPMQVDNATAQVADAKARGATIRTGGAAPAMEGTFFSPTVITEVPQEADVVQQESFAPLLPILVFDEVDEAIQLANDSHLGLMAYVFGPGGVRVAKRIESGMVMVDDVLSTYSMPETPWAGIKNSGLGRVHSDDSMRDMCRTHHVNHALLPNPFTREIWWYPYTRGGFTLIRRIVSLLFGRGFGRLSPVAEPDSNPGNPAALLPDGAMPTAD